MPRQKILSPKRSRKSSQPKVVQHRHFRLTMHPHRHVDIVTMIVLVLGLFVELVIMTSVPLGVSLFQLRTRDLEGRAQQLPVRSRLTYERWYWDEIRGVVSPSFFLLDHVTPEMIRETTRIHTELLEMRVPRFLQDVHLGLVVLASRKQAYISHMQDGDVNEKERDALRDDLAVFQEQYGK